MPEEKASEVHPVLYHYTAYEACKNIIRSQVLWAKYYRHLNDSTEVLHIQSRLRSAMLPRVKKEIRLYRRDAKKLIREFGSIAELAEYETDALLDGLFSMTFGAAVQEAYFPPYIVSFCTHVDDKHGYTKENGLLSMWRAYGGAVAIVFDTAKLEECIEQETEDYLYSLGHLADVVYEGDDTNFEEKFGPFIETFKETLIGIMTGPEGQPTITESFIRGFFSAATRYKHRAFAEEREVRLVMSPWTDGAYEIAKQTDIRGRKMKPRIDRNGAEFIDLFDGGAVDKLPIIRVIVGPHSNQDARAKELAKLLGKNSEIEVTCSETPYKAN